MPPSRIVPLVLDSPALMNADPRGPASHVEPHPASVHDDAPLRGRDELILPFVRACKPRTEFRIGAEAEKFGVFEGTYAPVHYRGAKSVETILRAFVDHHGWAEESEYEGAPTIALRRGETRSGMVERLIREAEMPRTRPMVEGRAAVDRLLATGRARV